MCEIKTSDKDPIRKFRVEAVGPQEAISALPVGDKLNEDSPFVRLETMKATRLFDGVFEVACEYKYKPPVWIESIELVGNDYKVNFKRQDSKTFSVLLPTESEGFPNTYVSEGGTYGLNLVTDGHYY